MVKAPHSTKVIWELIKSHFQIETRLDLLDSCYGNFKKSFFAGLCKKLAIAAKNGDPMCIKIFKDAGHAIARSVIALLPKVQNELINTGDLNIVCVGSVFLSWDLLKEGFVKELNNIDIPIGLSFKRLKQKMAMGAVYIAADSINFNLPRDYSKNYEMFYYYNQKQNINGKMNGNSNGTLNGK